MNGFVACLDFIERPKYPQNNEINNLLIRQVIRKLCTITNFLSFPKRIERVTAYSPTQKLTDVYKRQEVK